HARGLPRKESGMGRAPAAGAANGPANRNTPSECTSGDARTVLTTARLVRSSLRSARGPVDSPHPAAVSASNIQVIGLMGSIFIFLYPACPVRRHRFDGKALSSAVFRQAHLEPYALARQG